MKLFVKIFLWFLTATALMFGSIVFVTRTFQTDPMNSRFQRSTRNQMVVYAGTTTQIAAGEGEEGVRKFLSRLRDLERTRGRLVVRMGRFGWTGEEIGDSAS